MTPDDVKARAVEEADRRLRDRWIGAKAHPDPDLPEGEGAAYVFGFGAGAEWATSLLVDLDAGVWTCGHCGKAAAVHGSVTSDCLYEPVWKPAADPDALGRAYLIGRCALHDTPERGCVVCDATERTKAEALRERIFSLSLQWLRDQADYPDTEQGRAAAAAVRLCGREMLAALDPEEPR
jgi:hypothetical protein